MDQPRVGALWLITGVQLAGSVISPVVMVRQWGPHIVMTDIGRVADILGPIMIDIGHVADILGPVVTCIERVADILRPVMIHWTGG